MKQQSIHSINNHNHNYTKISSKINKPSCRAATVHWARLLDRSFCHQWFILCKDDGYTVITHMSVSICTISGNRMLMI